MGRELRANTPSSFADGAYSVPFGLGLGLAIDTDLYQRKYAGHEVRVM